LPFERLVGAAACESEGSIAEGDIVQSD
jgi:hypothetical protein